MNWKAIGPSFALCTMLAACGGGGDSGGVASTPPPPTNPTPPPPGGVNPSLLGPLKSESFANDAMQGSLSLDGSLKLSSGAAAATFIYDATAKTYTMTVGDHTKTFGPGDIDTTPVANPSTPAGSTTNYVVKSGNVTDSLTLTNAGTSGRFTYQYVGAAFWQNTNITGDSGNGGLYALTYGAPTPSAAVPMSGQGKYAIDLLAVAAIATTIQGGITGQGDLIVDFATHVLSLSGALTTGSSPGAIFNATGKLNATGDFNGTISLTNLGSGDIAGRFYGPNAQEVGASFSTQANLAPDNRVGNPTVSAGVILGRSETVGDPGSFASLTTPVLLNADRVRLGGDGTKTLGTAQVAITNGFVSLFAPDYALQLQSILDPNANLSNVAIAPSGVRLFGTLSTSGSNAVPASGKYYRAAYLTDRTGTNDFTDIFTFGFQTPTAAVPLSGLAAYQVNLDGAITGGTAGVKSEIVGDGTIGIDFATGQVTTNGRLFLTNVSNQQTPLANYSGTGAMKSGSSGFASSLSISGATTYSGSVQGNLYGPSVDEVAAVFDATGTDGANIVGVMTGAKSADVANPLATLSTLSGKTNFAAIVDSYAALLEPAYGIGYGFYPGNVQISYDATTKTYTFSGADLGALTGAFAPANIDNANSNATFTAYNTSSVSGRILNPGAPNPSIQLSYVSFADLAPPNAGTATDATHRFLVFGLRTDASGLPVSGVGTYSGVVYGRGRDAAIATGDVSVGGTGVLNADFGTGRLNARLDLNAAPAAGGAAQAIGSYTYAGTVSGTTFVARISGGNGNTISGGLQGAFFGPTANEVGAGFTVNIPNAANSSTGPLNVSGAFVGKKN